MMQGLQHQQQQLVALLSAALPKDGSASPPPPPPPLPPAFTPTSSSSSSAAIATSAAAIATTAPVSLLATAEGNGKSENGDTRRLSVLQSLHGAITYPPNSLLVAHSASFLVPGLSQLLSDKSYEVRQAAATAYGALCAVLCSIPLGSSGRPNHVMLGSLVDRFINWALPLLRHGSVQDGSPGLAVVGLREFLSIGDVNGIERYALPIFRACQELLEDGRTSMALLNGLLGVLSLISSKFSSLFHSHFLDIVDLLLGWALVPDLAESDRQIIMDSFLQFQKYWVNNLDFSLGLLSKFLGDMDVLLRDDSQGTPQYFHHLLALLYCFLAILRSTASGLLENNLLDDIVEPLGEMLPRLLGCLSIVGQRFGWSRWIEDLWKCLTLLAEILRERFCTFYPTSFDILFQSLEPPNAVNSPGYGKMTSSQIHGTLKTNLQLLSLQKLGLLSSCVPKLLHFDSPVSQLRMHPNHLVTASSAATYMFLLQHENAEIVQQVMELLMEELKFLKGMLGEALGHGNKANGVTVSRSFSRNELLALIKFDLKVLLACVSLGGETSLDARPELVAVLLERSEKLVSFVVEKLNPFNSPSDTCLDLQVDIVKMLERLAAIEFLSHCSSVSQADSNVETNPRRAPCVNIFAYGFSTMVIEHTRRYSSIIVEALSFSSPLAVKLVSLEWVQRFSENLIAMFENVGMGGYFYEEFPHAGPVRSMILAILDAAFDREPKVRTHSAIALELLLKAKLIQPAHFHLLAGAILEKIGDPDIDIKNAFVRLISHLLPATLYACGMPEGLEHMALRPHMLMLGNSCDLHWKQGFALMQLDPQFHSQQLVSVLSYISQRWKVPFSSWIQRLIHACRVPQDTTVGHPEENLVWNNGCLEIKADKRSIKRICLVNNLAGAWWAVHEAARFCVATRLRTNFGGPAQTFAALERMLLDIADVLQFDNEQTDGSLNIIGSSGAHLLPMRLLLDFMEALKKNVYNAYEGSVVLPSAPRQSVLFFRANKKVCEEWFCRISEPLMNAGISLQCQDATIEYCTLRLEELKGLAVSFMKEKAVMQACDKNHNTRARICSDILRILRHMSLALCKNHNTQALLGLSNWVSMNFAPLLVEENHPIKHSDKLGLFSWITGLVYQSEGQYEKAAAYFAHLLQEEDSLSSMGSDNIQFVIARIIENYTAVSDWKSLDFWLLELQALRARHAGKVFSGSLTTAGSEINAIQALARFDEGDHQAAWACLDLTPKTSAELSLDPKLALQRSEQMLLQAMLFQVQGNIEKVPDTLQKARSMLDETLLVLAFDGLSEMASYATQLHCISAFEESLQLSDSEHQSKQSNSILSSTIQSLQSLVNTVHCDCSPWLKVLRVYQTISPTSWVTLKLCLDLFGLARKQGKIVLANRLKNSLNDRVPNCAKVRLHDFLISDLQYQGALLMYAENKVEHAIMDLWSFVRPDVTALETVSLDTGVAFLKAKACLKLATWLRQDRICLDLENVVLKMAADFSRTEISCSGNYEPPFSNKSLNVKPSTRAIVEEMVGTFTKSSTQLCPEMGKSWISYASWCFCLATDSLFKTNETILHSSSFSSLLSQELKPGRLELTEDESECVKSAVQLFFQKGDSKHLKSTGQGGNSQTDAADHSEDNIDMKALVQQVVEIIENAAAFPAAENLSWHGVSATLASRLTDSLQSTNKEVGDTDVAPVVDRLVEVWWSLRKRRVSLFGHSAFGFIQYLLYASTKPCNVEVTGMGYDPLKQKTGSYTLRATLYILHILLNYGVELKDTLEHSLSMVPLAPWQEVTPQLFARLSSHPEEVIRKQIEGLLMMLAKLSPWSIVYPALVDVNACEQRPSEELLHIHSCLTELYPRLIQDVQLMINELGNVTVLWEELWLSTLQDLHMDVIRRINLLKEEAARIAENLTLSLSEKNKINAARYSAMMAPIVVALERRLASTSRKPETPRETWFHQEYIERLKSAILTFKTPPPSATALGEVWRPFENVAASLASCQRKSSISLKEVAPSLALLSSCDIPMPGLEKRVSSSKTDACLRTSLQGIVTVSSFSDQVTIISTKTRPKKLVMFGSDGKRYTYLLKGREDLRLDARIMQLLQAINSFFCSSPTTCGDAVGIRYYSVTPISGRAGLIQWVENVISIYSIFKSWQTRVQLAQVSPSVADSPNILAPPPLPRPIDMFYGKIIPALKDKGIRRVISRKDWPHDVKRKVLLDLMKEVPKQLLHQEIWCASEGFKAFSSKLKRYSGSVAAMSIVGHILGLGDRHLDNILMDFCSGDVVHIDYNVCFDKGQRLKVPEIVPFRLTQTIEAALGFTGVEGSFRANCEAVLGVLRKNKDIILMLMEAFVWDPLVEWTRGDFLDDAAIGGEERKGMEVAVSLSLFSSRVQEIRVPLQEHHDLLLTTLPAIDSGLEKFGEVLNQYEVASSLFLQADQERSKLILHETSAKTIVAEAACSSEKTRASFEVQAHEFSQAKAVVSEKAQVTTTWMEQHGMVLNALRRNLIPEITAPAKLIGLVDALSLTSAVLVAGVPLTVVPEPTQVQCHDIDREMSFLIGELDSSLSLALTSLQAYSLALQRILPLNYHTSSSVYGWAQVLQLAVHALSSDVLSLARRQAGELIAKIQGDNLDSIRNSYSDLCLKVQKYAAEIEKVEEEHAELTNSIGSGAELKTKDSLVYGFINYMQSAGLWGKDDVSSSDKSGLSKFDVPKGPNPQGFGEEMEKALAILYISVSSIYDQVKRRVHGIFSESGEGRGRNMLQSDSVILRGKFEEQVETCAMLVDFLNELKCYVGREASSFGGNVGFPSYYTEGNWASIFQRSLLSCKTLDAQMAEAVLPDVLKTSVFYNSELMDAFGLISQIRGSIDTALEHLIEVKQERDSLVELEQNYFVKVGLITERQLALEEAALKGRDHLSWEEAEELASQEETCRAQLDQLHQTWSQREFRISSLIKKEAQIKNALVSAERQFQLLISAEEHNKPNDLGTPGVLAELVKPFTELELLDRTLSSVNSSAASVSDWIPTLQEVTSSSQSLSEHIWSFGSLLSGHSFFIWKVGIIDSFLDSCIHDATSSVDQTLGFEQLILFVKKKLEIQLQERIACYLVERVAPAFLSWLDKENDHLKQLSEGTKDFVVDQAKKEHSTLNRVRVMLEEYCNAQETARAAKSAASLMKNQVNELRQALRRTSLEIIQMEWMHGTALTPSQNVRDIFQKFLARDDNLYSSLLNLRRPQLLETLQSAIPKIAGLKEGLQTCEQNSATAEGQLERAMGWACGGPSSGTAGSSSAKSSGIPPGFHDHLVRRRQLLWEAREKASKIVKVCMSVLEFEASRDGNFRSPSESHENNAPRTSNDARAWQQAYLNLITRLEVTYHSFTRTEQEWQLAQSNMEAASTGLYSATNELRIASLKAKSASGDLQSTVLAMRDCACEVSVALSAFSRVSRSHTALTSETGSMLEEVLAITEDLHDVHSLGKEAVAVHHSLVEDLSKASAILIPLDSMLSKDVALMTEAMAREKETKMEVFNIHGQAIYQSYGAKIRESCQNLKPLVPSILTSVKALYSMLTRLAQTASVHAGNLNKALEGLGETEETKSQKSTFSGPALTEDGPGLEDYGQENHLGFDAKNRNEVSSVSELSLEDRGWMSPPESVYSSGSESGITFTEASSLDGFNNFSEPLEHTPSDEEEAKVFQISAPSSQSNLHDASDAGLPVSAEVVVENNRDDLTKSSVNERIENTESVSQTCNNAMEVAASVSRPLVVIPELKSGEKETIKATAEVQSHGASPPPTQTHSRVIRGKNAYALSVLKRIEMKLDGRDIAENREISIPEQVDYLIKQATSLDNLCNMYEGWTPWI